METIRISPDRMKIILNEEDCRRFAVTDEAFEGDVRGLLGRILADTEEEALLNVAAGRLHLQVYEAVDGGCEIFLTCLAEERQEAAEPSPRYLALWDTDSLFMLCRRLKSSGCGGRLLRMGARWYLDFQGGKIPLAALDFGETAEGETAAYISEYATCLAEDVIAALG